MSFRSSKQAVEFIDFTARSMARNTWRLARRCVAFWAKVFCAGWLPACMGTGASPVSCAVQCARQVRWPLHFCVLGAQRRGVSRPLAGGAFEGGNLAFAQGQVDRAFTFTVAVISDRREMLASGKSMRLPGACPSHPCRLVRHIQVQHRSRVRVRPGDVFV